MVCLPQILLGTLLNALSQILAVVFIYQDTDASLILLKVLY